MVYVRWISTVLTNDQCSVLCVALKRNRKRAQRLLHLWRFDSTTQTFCSNYWQLECHLERERLLHLWNCGRPAPHKPRVGGTRGMWARFSAPPCKLTCYFLFTTSIVKMRPCAIRRHRNNCKCCPLLPHWEGHTFHLSYYNV